jgi:hypothetical protein
LPKLIEFMNSHFNKNNATTDWISSEINQLSKVKSCITAMCVVSRKIYLIFFCRQFKPNEKQKK